MCFSFDRTNFPLVTVPGMAVQVHLLPVTKVQFERFMAEANNDLGSSWYNQVLALNPRVSYRRFAAQEDRERLFITGVLPAEARVFAQWMGPGFSLPTLEEWRSIYRRLAEIPISSQRESLCSVIGPARIIIDKLLPHYQGGSLLDLSLMKGGVVEWVQQRNDNWVGVGQPRRGFFSNLLDPLSTEAEPIGMEERLYYFGFRLLCRQ
jgi:hypothetical protein